DFIFRKKLQDQFISDSDVLWVTRQRHPTERSSTLTKQGSNVSRDETRKIIRIADTRLAREGSDVIPVIKSYGSLFLEIQHGLNMLGNGGQRVLEILFGIAVSKFSRGLQGKPLWDVSVQRVMSTCLIG